MKSPKKKDNLTDLVEILEDGADETVSNEGKVTASDGTLVTLSAEEDEELTRLARKLVRIAKDKQKFAAFKRAMEKEK